jgi:hypothetical protein
MQRKVQHEPYRNPDKSVTTMDANYLIPPQRYSNTYNIAFDLRWLAHLQHESIWEGQRRLSVRIL